jgi:GNAT superfamily N-acetyltransferase
MTDSAWTITRGWTPGALGRVVALHGDYYHRHWGFGAFFEAKVAHELGAFVQRLQEGRDDWWTLTAGGNVEGGIAIDGADAAGRGAHLRWYIVSETLQGQGAGRALLTEALDFCRRSGHPRVFLWTFEGLLPARHLYETHGFRLVEARQGSMWGTAVTEQRFECRL